MEFQKEKVSSFLNLFNSTCEKIADFEGCMGLELFNDANVENILFTYSKWESLEHLENYRNSELFKQTWAKTKEMFCNKPEAWSLIKNKQLKQ